MGLYAGAYGDFWYAERQRIRGRSGLLMVPVYFASGNGGNQVYVTPDLGRVVAVTSAAYGRGYGQRRSEAILQALLRARLGAEGLGQTLPGRRPQE